jgi:Ca2+-binding RTX toxin-like protein
MRKLGVLLSILVLLAVWGSAQPASAAPNTLDMSSLPSAPWGHTDDGTSSATIANGVLTIDSTGYDEFRLDYPNGQWNAEVLNSRGWAIETRLRVDPSTVASSCSTVNIWANDYVNLLHMSFGKSEVCILYPNVLSVPFDTTSGYHTYRFVSKGQNIKLFIDGSLRLDASIAPGGGGSQLLGFGDFGSQTRNVIHWDSFTYDVAIGLPACTIVGTALDDVLYGSAGKDNICAGRGSDTVYASGGDDSVAGFLGNDKLYGGYGNDVLRGGPGNDTLNGGPGTDTCQQGTGTGSKSSCER